MSDFFKLFILGDFCPIAPHSRRLSIIIFTSRLSNPPKNMRIDVHGYADNRRELLLRQPPYQYIHTRLQTTITPQITTNSRRNRNLPKCPSPSIRNSPFCDIFRVTLVATSRHFTCHLGTVYLPLRPVLPATSTGSGWQPTRRGEAGNVVPSATKLLPTARPFGGGWG